MADGKDDWKREDEDEGDQEIDETVRLRSGFP